MEKEFIEQCEREAISKICTPFKQNESEFKACSHGVSSGVRHFFKELNKEVHNNDRTES